MGAPSVLIHNAVGGAWGTFMEIKPEILNRNFQVNTMGLLYLARRLAPSMVTAGEGAIIVTGKYICAAWTRELCGLRAHEGGATDSRRGDGAGTRPQEGARCLHRDRCGD
jgi:hypothetical protein